MVNESTLEIKMDSDLKEQVELLYEQMGTTFAEAKRTLGIANGRYVIPDDIDGCNDEISEMFGVKEVCKIQYKDENYG